MVFERTNYPNPDLVVKIRKMIISGRIVKHVTNNLCFGLLMCNKNL